MPKQTLSVLALASVMTILGHSMSAATFNESFSSNPATHGWRALGQTNLFSWNATNQNLEVTWDSTRPNSFFYQPFGTILNRSDDFSVEFDARLKDIAAGVDTNKPGTFEIAIGFINTATVVQTNFSRGTGFDSPNLVEFDYFPDTGFGATLSTLIISSNSQAYSTGGFVFPLELDTNALFHVALGFASSNQTLTTTLLRNGTPYGPANVAFLGTNFSDFRVDAIAVCSYSDLGQDPAYAGSIRAHGVVDNLQVTTPAPPVIGVTGRLQGAAWQVQFIGRSNWVYGIEGTADFNQWSLRSSLESGSEGLVTLQETNPPAGKAFYRVRAQKP